MKTQMNGRRVAAAAIAAALAASMGGFSPAMAMADEAQEAASPASAEAPAEAMPVDEEADPSGQQATEVAEAVVGEDEATEPVAEDVAQEGQALSAQAATKTSLSEVATISMEDETVTYTGTAQKPKATVTAKQAVLVGGKAVVEEATLTEGTDYTLSYQNNTKAGTARVIATGRGDYTGSVSKEFTIAKAKQDSISFSASDVTARYTTDSAATVRPSYTARGGYGEKSYKLVGTSPIKGAAIDSSTGAISYNGNRADAGTYSFKVRVTYAGDDNHVAGTADATLKLTVTKLTTNPGTVTAIALSDRAYSTSERTVARSRVLRISNAPSTVKVKNASSSEAALKYFKFDADGNLVIKKSAPAGRYNITAAVTMAGGKNYATVTKNVSTSIEITKASQTMTVAGSTQKVKASDVSKAKQSIALSKALTIEGAVGKKTYAVSGSKYVTLSGSKLVVAKGTPKGTYTAKVTVAAAGSANYKEAAKTAKVTIVVK